LSFRIKDYPLEFRASNWLFASRCALSDHLYLLACRFYRAQIIYAPVDEPGLIMLLDIKSVLPMTVAASFSRAQAACRRFDEQAHRVG